MISAACQNNSSDSPQTVSAGDLTKQYEKSNASDRNMYNGKEIIVRGYARRAAAMPKDSDNEGQLSLEEKGGASVRQVTCWFSRKEAAKFEQIKGDQYVTVKGVFNGEMGAELKFCKLVKVE